MDLTALPAGLDRPGASLLLFVIGMAWVAALDLRSRRVENRVTLTLLVAALVVRTLHSSFDGLTDGLLGAALGGGLLLIPFALRWLGGADVKVAAALGAWLGPALLPVALAAGFVVGGVMALALLLARPDLRKSVRANVGVAVITQSLPDPMRRRPGWTVPHVTAYAIGATAVVLAGVISGVP